MTALCQCDQQPEHPCGAEVTQEDLLCDSCRTARKTPGTSCLSVTIGCCAAVVLPHIVLFFDKSLTTGDITWNSGNAGVPALS